MEGKRNHTFQNWAEAYSCSPELYFEPETVLDLRQIIVDAKKNAKKVKVAGNGHSPSDIACTSDYMVSMKKFKKVLEIDRDEKTVKVESGILVSELNSVLEENGLALSVLGSVSDITFAGAISVGTHGTGKSYGCLHTFVLELELMSADGSLLVFSPARDADLFKAACVSLGSFGVLLTIKIQCEPMFKLEQIQYSLPLADTIENIDVHLSASDHFRFMWYPHTDNCTVYHVSRTSKPISRTSSWFWEYFIGYYVLEFLFWLSTFFPSMVPWINRTYFNLQSGRLEFVDKSFNVFNFNCLFKQYVMEWAIPRSNMGSVLYQLKAWIDCNFPNAHFPVEVRFVKEDSAFLSPCYGVDSCFINIVMYRPYKKDVVFDQYWKAFQDIVFKAGGRPHWAKDYRLTQKQMKELYPCWDKFVKIRQQLDPDRLFVNDNLQRIFA